MRGWLNKWIEAVRVRHVWVGYWLAGVLLRSDGLFLCMVRGLDKAWLLVRHFRLGNVAAQQVWRWSGTLGLVAQCHDLVCMKMSVYLGI